MVASGCELGLSIRGGMEHGLGIYISQVEEGSVAEAYGLKVHIILPWIVSLQTVVRLYLVVLVISGLSSRIISSEMFHNISAR